MLWQELAVIPYRFSENDEEECAGIGGAGLQVKSTKEKKKRRKFLRRQKVLCCCGWSVRWEILVFARFAVQNGLAGWHTGITVRC